MSKSSKMSMCYPYGMGVFCICDSRGRIFRCVNSMEAMQTDDDMVGEAMLRDDRGESGLSLAEDMAGLDLGSGRGLDERTEIILAATFLVLIILAFISFVIYRCEKNYMRRRLQESFHLSPSSGGGFLGSAGGLLGGHGGQIPTISVSVQTEPTMAGMNGTGMNGLANTSAMLSNGGPLHQLQNGSIVTSSNNNNNGNNTIHHSATLPHSHHHAHHVHSAVHHSANVAAAVAASNHDILDSNGTGGVHDGWSRDNLLAQSYRDVRDVALTTFPSGGGGISHSRDNTLSRDMHHITDRDMGMRNSCTTENLRSPSVAGTNGRDDDDLNTDYAESDVMLGGNNSNGSNNGGNNNNNSGGGNNDSNNGHRY